MHPIINFLNSAGFKIENGIFIRGNHDDSFENEYVKAREKEGRIYSIGEIQKLPDVPKQHQYAFEWQIRKKSALKFVHYLQKKDGPLNIMEIGCGNGWFTHFLASRYPENNFVGVDLNSFELKQASGAFNETNITWLCGNIDEDILPAGYFDIIIFAASIQYFEDLKSILSRISRFLKPGGEIHILDSPFYADDELPGARERTLDYYRRMGNEGMASHYFHHSASELCQPGFIVRNLNTTPKFPWFKNLQIKLGFDFFDWFRIKKV